MALDHLRRQFLVGAELFGPVPWRERARFGAYLLRSRLQASSSAVARFTYGPARVELPVGGPAGLKFLLEVLGRDVYRDFVTDGRGLLFDVGAHVGALTLQRCLANAELRAVAVEPRPATFQRLERHVALNGLQGRVTTVRAAVSDSVGQRALGLPVGSTMGVVREPGAIDPSGPVMETPATTLDALAEAHGDPDVLKVDVEGHEVAVLAGGARTLERVAAVVLEVHTPGRRDACAAILQDHGLRVRDAYPLLFARRP